MPEDEKQEETMDETMGRVFDLMQEEDEPEEEKSDATREGVSGDEHQEVEAEAQEEREDEEVATKGDTEDEGEPQEETLEPIVPHPRWTNEVKEQFNALPREAQEIVLSRESEVEAHLTQQSQEIAEQKRVYGELEQAFAPRRQAWAAQGMNDQQAVNQLLALSDYAAADPAGFIAWMAQQRGVDLEAILDGTGVAQPDPAVVDQNQRLAAMEQRFNEQEFRSQTEANLSAEQQINAFKETKDDKGSLKYPHFETVSQSMGALMQTGQASSIESAYEMAVWANPTVRSQLLSSQDKARETQAISEKKASAAKAKKATSVNVSAKGSSSSADEEEVPETWEETMGAAYDRMQNESA